MERLIYTNAIGQSVEFSSESLYRWTQVDDLGALEASFQTSSSPFQDGTTSVGDPYFEPRVIKVELQIISTDLQAAIRDLNRILNPKIGMGSLTYERNGVKKVLNKVKTRVMPSLPGGASRGVGFQVSSVIFEAFNPYYTDEAFTEAVVETGGFGLNFPLDITEDFEFDWVNSNGITVTNAGDVECPVTIILDGPMTSPLSVENLTTGEKITLALDLLENEQLIITTEIDDINVIKRNTVTDVEIVAFQYIDVAETTFFYLAQGTNTIRVTADEAEMESATLKFKQQYVGV